MKALFLISSLIGFTQAVSAATYTLSVTNGSNTSLSGGVVYTSRSAEAEAKLGSPSMAGLTTLCQTGMPGMRVAELQKNSNVVGLMQTDGPIAPGQSKTFEVDVNSADVQGVHFEVMYINSKDACGVVSANRHNLTALSQHVVSSVSGRDQVILSGGFHEPVAGHYAETTCAGAMKAVDCLRLLSTPKMGANSVKAFNGYLPSVLGFLETRYGAEDTQTLLFPTGGAIHFSLALKH